MTPRKSAEDWQAEERVRAYLREYLEERDIDQAELARRLDTTQATVSRILGGKRGIGLGLATRISRALRISLVRLLEENPDERFWTPGTYPTR